MTRLLTVDSVGRGSPFLVHDMVGVGLPSASHRSSTLLPILFNSVFGAFIKDGGTEPSGGEGKAGATWLTVDLALPRVLVASQ